MVHVARLSLDNFRSYTDAVVAPGPGLVVLTGENGAGKTNVLEAVSLLAPGRGLRQATLGEMARQPGPGGFAVTAQLATPSIVPSEVEGCGPGVSTALDTNGYGCSIIIGTGTTATAPERRQLRINGATAALTSLGEWLAVLWLTPAMDRLFLEGASGRRRFLDRLTLALEPGHAVQSSRYEAAMRARNRLLSAEEAPDPQWLSALEAQMASHGSALAEARERTAAALGERLADQPDDPFARAGVTLGGWRPQGEEHLRDALAASRAMDAAAGRTSIGPHRTDLIVTHIGKNQPADRCSTGEQKALLLGMVLAHADLVAERGDARPILLLDEVAAHLDPRRRAALFERLLEGGGQVWMTGTEPALFEGIGNASAWTISEGRIEAA